MGHFAAAFAGALEGAFLAAVRGAFVGVFAGAVLRVSETASWGTNAAVLVVCLPLAGASAPAAASRGASFAACVAVSEIV